eukprot:2607349-Ditylum_brightwellii.AAC.1
MCMDVKTGTSSIQVASFKYTETLLCTLQCFMDSVAMGLLSSLFKQVLWDEICAATFLVKRYLSALVAQCRKAIIKLRSKLSSPFL